MDYLGSAYVEDGPDDIVIFGINPRDEINDAQGTVHEFGHEGEAWDHPVVYPRYKGKVVKGVRELGTSGARKVRKASLEALRGSGMEGEGMTDEDLLRQALQGEGAPPPLPPREMASRINQAINTADKFSSIKEFEGLITHANIGLSIENLTPKEMRALDIYVARAIRLWLKMRGKRRFVRKTVGGIKLKRGSIFGSEGEREERTKRKHASAMDLLRRYRNRRSQLEEIAPELPPREEEGGIASQKVYDNFYNSMGSDSVLETVYKAKSDGDLYNVGLGERMYYKLYNLDESEYKDRQKEAMDYFEQRFGLRFKEFGKPRDEKDEKNGTLCLFPQNDSKKKPYAIFSNYLMNPKRSKKVTIASSSLGHGLKDKTVSEAGWMVKICNKSGVSLEGTYKKVAQNGAMLLFGDVHVPTVGTESLGDEGYVGSAIGLHIESSRPSYTADDGELTVIPLNVSRVVDNGDSLGVTIKSTNRQIECPSGGGVCCTSRYAL